MSFRWRVKQIGKPDRTGAWCATRQEAKDDAVRCDVAKQGRDGGYFFDLLTSIEEGGP